MIDVEKVIKGLKQHKEARLFSCDDCPYTNEPDCQSKLCSDILALLEEQKPVEPIDIIDEKYPVGDHSRYRGYRCGKCQEIIPWDANYCPYCGRKVKWDD